MKSLDIEWLSMTDVKNCGKVFKGVSIPFDVYVARNSDTSDFMTDIQWTDGSESRICIKGMDFIPNFAIEKIQRLVARKDEKRIDFRFSTAKFETRQKWMSNKETKEFCHPCVYSVSPSEDHRQKNGGKLTFWYSNTKTPKITKEALDHFGVPKVIFGTWHGAGIPHIDIKGKYGMCQDAAAIADDPAVLPLIAKAMDGVRFRDVMATVQFTTREWNRHVIPFFRKDFWKEFVNSDGDWIDDDGNVIDREGNLLDAHGNVISSENNDVSRRSA